MDEKKRKVRIILTFPDGEEKEYPYLKAAAEELSLNPNTLSMVARGYRNHHKNFRCRYVKVIN